METALDITVLPILIGRNRLNYGLVLTRESTLERNFITALVSSRQLFKDLVGCSSDFAWETRPDGTFAFVSRRGALGYTARELYGRAPDSMLLTAMNSATLESPFLSRTAREDVEVWVEDAHARPACLLVSCVPVFDAQGNWTGTRGVCRDVTEERELTAALETARNRERLLGQVVDSIRTEIEPPAMLGAAARAVASTLRASHCWIVRARNGRFTGAQQAAGLDGPPENRLVDVVNAQLHGTKEELFVKINDRTLHVIANVSRYHDAINGAICVARPEDGEHWTDDDRILLTGVGDHLGIAIAQIENREQLEEMSRTDELTQLFNRRAFADEVSMRLRALRRTERKAALFYVDLDNFKRVNDVHGHKRGDEALVAVAKLLVENSRAGDIIARLAATNSPCGWKRPMRRRAIPRPRHCCSWARSCAPFPATRPIRSAFPSAWPSPTRRRKNRWSICSPARTARCMCRSAVARGAMRCPARPASRSPNNRRKRSRPC